MTTGTERSSVLGGRQEEKARSERDAVEHSKPVRQPLGMTDHRESNDAWMVPVGSTSRLIGGVDVLEPACPQADFIRGKGRQRGCSRHGDSTSYLLTPP